MRLVGIGATAASTASSAGWFRSLPAPGVRSNAPGFIRASSEKNAARFGELRDALRGALRFGAMVGMSVAHEPAERALHLALGRGRGTIVESEQGERPLVRVQVGRR